MNQTTARVCGRIDCSTTLGDDAHPNARYCSATCRKAHNAPTRRAQARDAKRVMRQGWSADQRAAANAAARSWRARNPDRVRANNRAAYEADPGAYARQRDNWRAAHPEESALQARNAAHLRRVRRRAGGAFRFTTRDWQRACARVGQRCAYCFEDSPLTMEHIIPLSRGGRHSIGNMVPVCEFCNKSKGALLLMEWRVSRAQKG